MGYLDRYRKRAALHGTTYREVMMNQEVEVFERDFTDILGWRMAQLNEQENMDVVIQSTTNNLTKSALLRPSDLERVGSGSYLTFDDETWIIRSINKSRLSPVAELYLCNQLINFPHAEKGVPCYANSTSFGTKGLTDTDKFYELDSKTRIYIQRNELTETLTLGYRFMLSHRYVYQITEIDDMVYPGMYIVTCKMVELCDMDNPELNLAYNGNPLKEPKPEPIPLQLVGEPQVKRGSTHIYEIVGAVGGEWSLDNPQLATLYPLDETHVEVRFHSKSDWVELKFVTRHQEDLIEVMEASLDILIC